MSTTMPALYTVLVGDDPERRVAFRDHQYGAWGTYKDGKIVWRLDSEGVHDVRPVIPEGTPVERIVVLPEVGEVTVDEYGVYADSEMYGDEDADSDWPFVVRRAANDLAVYRKAAAHAARTAEPTPDPLDVARPELRGYGPLVEVLLPEPVTE